MNEDDVCPCGASASERCRFVPAPSFDFDDWEDVPFPAIQHDDWDDAPASDTDSQQEPVQTDEQDERAEFVDDYLRGKAMDDLIEVVVTVIVFLTMLNGIRIDD